MEEQSGGFVRFRNPSGTVEAKTSTSGVVAGEEISFLAAVGGIGAGTQ